MSKFIIDIDSSTSFLERFFENELDCKVSVSNLDSVEKDEFLKDFKKSIFPDIDETSINRKSELTYAEILDILDDLLVELKNKYIK